MWVAVNGKRVDRNATMAQIVIQDQDTIRCYGRLLGGAQRFRQPWQDIPGQWTCSLCGQERVWPTKNRCFRCGNPKHHNPVSPGPVIGPTGRAPQRVLATNPTFRRDGRQNKISGQHVPSVVPPRQSPTENVGSSNAVPWAPGVRVDLVRELLNIFSPMKTTLSTVHSWSHQNGKCLRSIKIWLTNLRSMARS